MKKFVLFFALLFLAYATVVSRPRRNVRRHAHLMPHSPYYGLRKYTIPNRGRGAFIPKSRRSLPVGSLLRYPGIFFGNGIFYKRSGAYYIPIAAPAGFLLPALPLGCRRIHHRGFLYFEYGGNFYRETGAGYIATPIPHGICLENLPFDEAVPLDENQQEFLFHDHIWLKIESEGSTWYQESGEFSG